MVNPFSKFTINHVSKKLNKINLNISLSHQKPFPNIWLLSNYQFKKRFVKIDFNGDIQGGMAKMITSLIDFSFIRALVADCYSPYGPPCYDPPSLFLLDLFRYVDGYQNMSKFLALVRDKDRGRCYRTHAGISMDNVPCEGTFSIFRARLSEKLYNEIFHVLVHIFHELEMITFKILAHDGTLYPTWARYKGCTYFCDQCSNIRVEDVIGKVKNRILYRLNNIAENNLGSEVRVYTECPSDRFPEDVKKPKIELFAFKIGFTDGDLAEEQRNTAILFGVEEELAKQQLCIHTLRSNVININFNDSAMSIQCPRLPKDTDARIGVRRDPQNPDKKQKIFGYNLVLSTSVEVHLQMELPVAVTNISGNAEEGSQFIKNKEQMHNRHQCQVKIDILDAKYDIINNYNYIRGKGSIPIIDYNPRNEKLSKQNLVERGYDQNGWPFAPCGLLCRPNGFDKKHQRMTFCCFKQCLKLRPKALHDLQARFDISSCPHIENKTGFAKHMYVKEHPRLVNEIPRGSKRYKEIKKIRSASERSNSTLKEDTKILDKPRVMNSSRANILAQMAAIVLLLKRTFAFIVRTTNLFRKLHKTNDPDIEKILKPPLIPKSMANIIQLE
ncbi:MAG: hypothetical protein KKE59_09360 [Proteobacteria bacterium]|nr:hypothetical protein [Pseudomonadota bacterium]